MPVSLFWLALGAFAIGTEGYVIAGLLPAIAGDLGVSIPMAGQLVTGFALAYALGSPLLAVATGALNRRRLMLVSLGTFVLGNLLAAFAHRYAVLMAARLAMALAAATYMPAASAHAAAAVAPERRGRALAVIYSGLTLAMAIGTPLGVIVGHRYGWRLTFVGVAAFAGLAMVGLRLVMPAAVTGTAATLAERLAVARRSDVLGVLFSTVLVMAGVFTVYTYLAPFLKVFGALDGQALAAVLFFFGLGSAAGNLLSGAASDRFGPRRVLGVVLVGLVSVFSLLSVTAHTLPPAAARPVLMALIALWGLVGFAFPSAQQSRLVRLDPRLAPITLSLNGSAIYGGISLGALLGSLVVSRGQLGAIGWAAAACELAGLAVVQLAGRARPVAVPVAPEVRRSQYVQ
jgi:predicted MFS family arabinose efflux permease